MTAQTLPASALFADCEQSAACDAVLSPADGTLLLRFAPAVDARALQSLAHALLQHAQTALAQSTARSRALSRSQSSAAALRAAPSRPTGPPPASALSVPSGSLAQPRVSLAKPLPRVPPGRRQSVALPSPAYDSLEVLKHLRADVHYDARLPDDKRRSVRSTSLQYDALRAESETDDAASEPDDRPVRAQSLQYGSLASETDDVASEPDDRLVRAQSLQYGSLAPERSPRRAKMPLPAVPRGAQRAQPRPKSQQYASLMQNEQVRPRPLPRPKVLARSAETSASNDNDDEENDKREEEERN